MDRHQLKAMIKSLHNTREQYGRLAQKAEKSRREQRNDSSSERDRCEMGQTMCTVLIGAYEAALAVTDPARQTRERGSEELRITSLLCAAGPGDKYEVAAQLSDGTTRKVPPK